MNGTLRESVPGIFKDLVDVERMAIWEELVVSHTEELITAIKILQKFAEPKKLPVTIDDVDDARI